MSRRTKAQLEAENEVLRQQVESLRTGRKTSNGNGKTWKSQVSAGSILRVNGITTAAHPFLAKVDKLPVGEELVVPGKFSKPLNQALGRSSFAGVWDEAARQWVYTRRTSASGKTVADGVTLRVTVPKSGERTIARIA